MPFNQRMNSGSSVLVAILIDNKLVVAQSGDCAAISIRGEMPHRYGYIVLNSMKILRILRITADHTFGNKDELQRAKALDSLFGVTPTSVIPPVSRGVGWLNFREPKEIITSDPEIFTEILTPRDQVTRSILFFTPYSSVVSILFWEQSLSGAL
jgi:serine/threonine protein phosphatase PrpC